MAAARFADISEEETNKMKENTLSCPDNQLSNYTKTIILLRFSEYCGIIVYFHNALYKFTTIATKQTLGLLVSANIALGLDFIGLSANFTVDCFPSSSSESSSPDAPKNFIRGRKGFLDSVESKRKLL